MGRMTQTRESDGEGIIEWGERAIEMEVVVVVIKA